MSVITTKRNGKIEQFTLCGDRVSHFLSLLEALWNESTLASDNENFKYGIDTLQLIMRDYK